MDLTQAEQDEIKAWVLKCAHPDVILRMQNNTQELSFMYDARYASKGIQQCYESADPGETIPFKHKVQQHKYYAAAHGINVQGLMKMLSRGGHQQLAGLAHYKQEAAKRFEEDRLTDFSKQRRFAMALVEAQTGFFSIKEDEFEALKTVEKHGAYNGENPYDNYGDIAESRPVALKEIAFEEFMQLRQAALQEANLWLGPVAAAAPAPAPVTPVTHAAKIAATPPAASWTEDATNRDQLAALLERQAAGLALAEQQAKEIAEKQAAHAATLADLQALQKQITAINKGTCRG